MTHAKIQEDMLKGIEINIEEMARQITQLKIELASLRINGGSVEQRRVIRKQLTTLQETWQLLQIRRVYALEVREPQRLPRILPQVDQRTPKGGMTQPMYRVDLTEISAKSFVEDPRETTKE